MRISYFPKNIPGNSKLVLPQILDAVKTTDTLVENNLNADAALIWSVLWYGKMSSNKQVWDIYRNLNKPVIVIEVGALKRNNTWKLGINGINRDADFALDQGYNDARLEKFNLDIKPWNNNGEYIVIAGQHGESEQWRYMPSMEEYYKLTVSDIRKYSNKPIVIRSHPRYRENLHFSIKDPKWFKEQNCEWNLAKQVVNTYDSFDFENQLKHTYCVYSHSGNAGLTSIINGVPAVVSEHSLAYEVGSNNIQELEYPDRHDWLCKMSYIEWFPEEIDQQWKRIRSKL